MKFPIKTIHGLDFRARSSRTGVRTEGGDYMEKTEIAQIAAKRQQELSMGIYPGRFAHLCLRYMRLMPWGSGQSVTQCLDNTSSHSPGCPNTSCDMDRGKRVCLDSFSKEQDSSFPPVLGRFILVLFSLFFPPFLPLFSQRCPSKWPCELPVPCSCCLSSSRQLAGGSGAARQQRLPWPLCCRVCTMPRELRERTGTMYTGDIPGVIPHHGRSLDRSGPGNFFHSSPLKSTVESNFKHLDHREYINTCTLARCNNSVISMTPWWANRISQACFIFQMGQSWIFFWISTFILS